MTKAKLLRGWINSCTYTSTTMFKDREFTTFNMRFERQYLSHLDSRARELGLLRSAYIRNIIAANITKESAPAHKLSQTQDKHPITSDYNELIERLMQNWHQLTLKELFLLAVAYTKTGHISEALVALDELERRGITLDRNSAIFVKADVWRANIARLDRQINISHTLLINALKAATKLQQNELIGHIHSQISILHSIENNYSEAINSAEKAVEYFNPITDRGHFYHSYIRLAQLESNLGNQSLVDKYLQKAENYSHNRHTDALGPHYLGRKALCEIRAGDTLSAKLNLETAISLNRKLNSTVELFYNHENLGNIHLINGELDLAYCAFQAAEEYESQIRAKGTKLKHMRSSIYKLFIEAKHNYTEVSAAFDAELEPTTPASFASYIRQATDYLYSPRKAVKVSAAKKLEGLAVNSPYHSVRAAANQVLHHQTLGVW